MRQYVGLVFDDWVSGLAPVYTPSPFDTELGRYEQVAIQAIVTRVGGSSPRLSVMLQCSSSGRHWHDKTDTPAIESASLSAGVTNVLMGVDAGEVPTLAYARWLLRLEGTNPRAHIRLWTTGRGKASTPPGVAGLERALTMPIDPAPARSEVLPDSLPRARGSGFEFRVPDGGWEPAVLRSRGER